MILILLSSYNGSKYLHDFLSSLEKQTLTNWMLLVRDDGSSDNSLEIVKSFFKDKKKQLLILPSDKNVGTKESFNLLMHYAIENTQANYIMFADQDDVWKPAKIELTLLKMKTIEKENLSIPLLVHTDLHVSDRNLKNIHPSLWDFERNNPSLDTLNYLLFQNTATGCTMMLNRALLQLSYPISNDAIMHDWWVTLVASCFGKIQYIKESTIYYRQHESNTIGAKEHKKYHLFFKIFKIFLMQNEPYLLHLHTNRKQADSFLKQYSKKLKESHREILKCFISLPEKSWIEKRAYIIKYRCFRQRLIQTIALLLDINHVK